VCVCVCMFTFISICKQITIQKRPLFMKRDLNIHIKPCVHASLVCVRLRRFDSWCVSHCVCVSECVSVYVYISNPVYIHSLFARACADLLSSVCECVCVSERVSVYIYT